MRPPCRKVFSFSSVQVLEMGRENPFIVTPITLRSTDNAGERLPMTLYRNSRVPVVKHNEWALSKRRGVVSANTLERELRALTHLQVWLDKEDLSLDKPFAFIEQMLPGRIEASLRPYLAKDQSDKKVKKISIGSEQIAERLWVASSYIDWALEDSQRKISLRLDPEKCIAFENARAGIRKTFSYLMPTQTSVEKKVGLSRAETCRLLDLARPENPNNVWGRGSGTQAKAIRYRNQAIIHLGVAFGPRRGDKLKLHTSDVRTHGSEPTLSVRRRPNDHKDPRKWEPNAKTLERLLPLDSDLAMLLNEYVLKWRKLIPGHKKTPYLFLSYSGKPMSLRAYSDIFEALQIEFPNLHSHILRHTHNDRLRERCIEIGMSDADYVRDAMYLTGWASDNTSTYTNRSSRERANRISRDVQNQVFSATKDVPF
jgi:integrase